MCGIVGVLGQGDVADRIVKSLKKLEYRGYDSAGVATGFNYKIKLQKVVGKLHLLEEALKDRPISGKMGIGHTRWATHGSPTVENAHPIVVNKIAVVHNGIIENHLEIREELQKMGVEFQGDTDTEVVPHLINQYLAFGYDIEEAVKKTAQRLKGAFAVAIMFADNDNFLAVIKNGSPLALGLGKGEMYLGSDALALSSFTQDIIYLEDRDFAYITRNDYKIFNLSDPDKKIDRQVKKVAADFDNVGKGNFAHYMLKEIYEQPQVLSQIFDRYYDKENEELKLDCDINWDNIERVYIVACGTSYHAAMVAKYWFEKYARISVEIDIASEFRYRSPFLVSRSVTIFISQSGETADTLAALKYVRDLGLDTIALVNVVESSIANLSKYVFPIYAGMEIGVASTKAFTAQLLVLAMLCFKISQQKNAISKDEHLKLIRTLHEVPSIMQEVLRLDETIQFIAQDISAAKSLLCIGRGSSCAIAMEGALKIKELSYIHAEGIASGELKHGPIALIDKNLPVVAIVPYDELFAKSASNIQEVHARFGKLIIFTDENGRRELKKVANHQVILPEVNPMVAPIIYSLPLQLLAYHAANILGHDVDQPRNLAKSVTVE